MVRMQTEERRQLPTSFTINGRFFSQAASGVQRYAQQIVESIDRQAVGDVVLALPPGDVSLPPFGKIRPKTLGASNGYLWEQVMLPALARGPLLNLCNLGPVVRSDQIVCMHDANVYTDPNSYSRAFQLAYRTLQPLLARRAARVTTVSKFSATMLAKYLPIKATDILVLPNGHEHVHAWDASRSTILSSGAARPFVLLIGSKAKHKNADLILSLADALDELGLDIYIAGGQGRIFAATETRERANIVRLGFVSDDDLAALYARASCLVFPSWSEGFGLPIVEAMALGCPVISSDRASMPEVGGAAARYAAPDDPAGWLGRIREIAGSEALRQDMISAGREQARKFSWTQSAAGYLEALAAI